ncbi:MAG: 30S ribosomal protein S8e [Thermoprotei archaeon]|nr:MAG: 30S ribosomal protein S8e [Thermoprotei archaeon]RLF01037.1 MAG: 30S ribosomal protein S8e [Thermoprotei archaeon]HDI74445.1 30S ribosomal protein S8e [Thermoprotei archaeon]
MGIYQGNDLRKPTGGMKRPHRKVKRKCHMGRPPTLTTLGEENIVKKIRVRGGNFKLRLKKVAYANVFIPSKGVCQKARILKVVKNPANRQYARRQIITKGCIISTELGEALVTSRPGQDGVLNAILLEET